MNYYEEIKNELLNNEINKKVKDYSKNKYELESYYNVGKLLFEAGKHYGESIIKNYSIKLTNELGKGYSERNLQLMRKFYCFQKTQAVIADLSWTHYCQLLPLNNDDEINYYISVTIKHNLSYRKLGERIKSKEYERLDDKTKLKLINKEEINVNDFIPNPIIIYNKNNYKEITVTEKVLKKLILEDIDNFIKNLGEGFSYIGNEYPIKIGSKYNYIDILLFNIKYCCYVVVELKVTELKKEYIGQIETYMNYIDKEIKTINHNKTVGIIVVKKDNKYIMEYCSNPNIFSKEYLVI